MDVRSPALRWMDNVGDLVPCAQTELQLINLEVGPSTTAGGHKHGQLVDPPLGVGCSVAFDGGSSSRFFV